MKILSKQDFNKNESKNLVIDNLSQAPSSPFIGQVYYNTTEDKAYVYANSEWISLTLEEEISISDTEPSGDDLKLWINPEQQEISQGYDVLPVGSEFDYDGETVPDGYEEIASEKSILWTNPNPSNQSGFAGQTINLSSSDYDIYEVFYAQSFADTSSIILSQRSIKGYGTVLFSSLSVGLSRRLSTATPTTITFADTSMAGSNLNNIPVYVVGYKTGTFN